ncbi:MAG TPA: terminase [Alphaproteobacteria bacterium]|nr:terminase [Alphaproteobacteria bacterium]
MKRNQFTQARRGRFLAALEASGNVSVAARAAGIGRATAYRWRGRDVTFAADWDEAEAVAADALEREAWHRAVEGVPEPVVSAGRLVMVERADGSMAPLTIRRYSDALLITLLRARRPEKFRERAAVQITGKGDGPIEVSDVRERIASELARIAAAGTPGGASGTLAAMSPERQPG